MQAEAAHRHKLGHKWICFECSSRFYDLNKADPLCPRCGVDQRAAPPLEVEKPKRVRRKAAEAASELEKSPEAAAAEASAEEMGLKVEKVESETDELEDAIDEELDLEMGDEPGELEDDEVATG